MKRQNLFRCTLILVISALLVAIIGCAPKDTGKVPITTTSKKARDYFLQGRYLFETLQAQESKEYFEKAVAEDPDFATAYLFLAFAQPSVKGFFEQLDKAKALADNVSDGERWYILGVEAVAGGLPMKQREYYQRMVGAYPNDERAFTLLGNSYFGQQDYEEAIEQYNRAVEINPEFSQPYNQLGYSYRFLEDYASAEEAFQKYIELIPNDPNPYDSYAELLMKMGRYDESIEHYRMALEQNPNFVASFIGIATNMNYQEEHKGARKELEKLYGIARNDGERRAALLAMAVSYVDEGNLEQALIKQDEQYALAEKINDAAAMAGDLVVMGNILLEMGHPDKAMEKYNAAMETVAKSDLSNEVKENSRRVHLFNTARVALKKKDFAAATVKAEEYRKRAEAVNNPNQIRLAHQLAGMIALEEKQYDKALEELRQASQQDPYNWYRMALVYRGKGDKENAKNCCKKAAEFNALNNMNQAFIRHKAKKMLGSM
jgi:tetratricopeptide (TPR) repeat protein